MENIIASIPIASAIIAGTSGWIGYKLNNSIKMKSEIEDSRIEWIQQVRSINLNIIKSSYQFIIETDSYIKSKNLLEEIEEKQKDLVDGLIYQKNRDDEENIETNYEKQLKDIVSRANNENSNLENIMNKRINAMYTVLSYIEQMKNLFPINRYYIEKTKLLNKKVLIARSKHSYYIKEDESIENKDICDVLEKLKKDIKNSYNDDNLPFEEANMDEYSNLITNYLKIEWEKVKSKKRLKS